jgi:hypothetical protein
MAGPTAPVRCLLLVLLAAFIASSWAHADVVPAKPSLRVIFELESEPLASRFGPALVEDQRKRHHDGDGDGSHAHSRFDRLVERDIAAREHLDQLDRERSALVARYQLSCTTNTKKISGFQQTLSKNWFGSEFKGNGDEDWVI